MSKQRRRMILTLLTGAVLLGLLALGVGLTSPASALDAEQVYSQAVHGTVWIVNRLGWFSEAQGSGYLADKQRHLVVTNYHVTSGHWYMHVYFPVRNATGKVIQEASYYRSNQRSLSEQGYATRAELVAYDKEKDLAVLRAFAVPRDAVALRTANGGPTSKETLHVIGNPANRPLWTYCPGVEPKVEQFHARDGGQERNFRAIIYKSGVFHGNSGGPVLNQHGQVVGVNAMAGGEGNMFAIAVHFTEIDDLLQSIETYHVVGIENTGPTEVCYYIRWGNGPWEMVEIKGKSRWIHWYKGEKPPKPEIAFDCSAAPGYQEKRYTLETYVAYLGRNVKPDFDRHAREYCFKWTDNNTLDLFSRR
jgi:V8-like Glu-specific endopeptidase